MCMTCSNTEFDSEYLYNKKVNKDYKNMHLEFTIQFKIIRKQRSSGYQKWSF